MDNNQLAHYGLMVRKVRAVTGDTATGFARPAVNQRAQPLIPNAQVPSAQFATEKLNLDEGIPIGEVRSPAYTAPPPGIDLQLPDVDTYAATKGWFTAKDYKLTRSHRIPGGCVTYHISRRNQARAYTSWAGVIGFQTSLRGCAPLQPQNLKKEADYAGTAASGAQA